MRDIVIGIDASTTAVKAIAFLKDGTALSETRAAYPLSTPHPGHVEQDASDWWTALSSALRELSKTIDVTRIAGMALAHQRETFVFLDADGQAVRPAILWLDDRARPQVAQLSKALGRETIRDWTGKPPDPTPALYDILWLAQHEPEALKRATHLADVNAYLHFRLVGRFVTATASADPLGLLNIAAQSWQPELVQACGLVSSQLPDLVAPAARCGTLTATAARACGLPEGLPVYAGGGDGQVTGLGLGVVSPGSAYLSLGSGVVCGMYAKTPVTSDAFRTLIAPSGPGYMLETVLRSGMQLVEWVVRTTGSNSAPALEALALSVPPGSEGLLLMPYWAGVMSPYWDNAAKGAMVGLTLSHTPAHLLRAALEGIALEQAIASAAMEGAIGQRAEQIIACGGGVNSRLLVNVMAAALNRAIAISPVKEAAALGAAILAALGSGWFSTAQQACASMCVAPTDVVVPDSRLVSFYGQQLVIYGSFYESVRALQQAQQRLHASTC